MKGFVELSILMEGTTLVNVEYIKAVRKVSPFDDGHGCFVLVSGEELVAVSENYEKIKARIEEAMA